MKAFTLLLLAALAVPAAGAPDAAEQELQALWAKTRDEFIPLCEGFQFHTALERAMGFITATNAYIEKLAPWKLGKSSEPADQARLRTALATMAEALRLATALLGAVMPAASARINGVLGYASGATWRDELAWDARLAGRKVAEALVLFPRPAPADKAPAKP